MQQNSNQLQVPRGFARRRRIAGDLFGWRVTAILVAVFVAIPIGALVYFALSGHTDALQRISRTVLPRSSATTFWLLLGVGLGVGFLGSVSAWLVTFFDFPLRKVWAWALMLPFAVPTYISAYTFAEFLGFTGPIQWGIRLIFGFELANEYWFPDVRSLPGAILTMSLVLYPYVYLAMRGLFLLQGKRAVEAAVILGAKSGEAFWRVLLPLSRPALVLGITLALMEVLNDIGAMEFLGINTLTFAVFSLWRNQSDLAGAAQLALVLLAVVVILMALERMARSQQKFSETSAAQDPFARQKLSGVAAFAAFVFVLSVVLLGFGVPAGVLATYASRYIGEQFDFELLEIIWTSVSLGGAAALVTVVLAILIAHCSRISLHGKMRKLTRFSAIGYALPGTIVALGIFYPIAHFDNFVDGLMRDHFGISTGLLLSGSGATLVYAYAVRFLSLAEGNVDSGFQKISGNIDSAARVSGYSRMRVLWGMLIPLSAPAIGVAAILVFIETIKELSATMLLRPFGLETLAIYVHDLATRGRIEEGSFAALIIVLVGLAPVLILTRSALKDRN